ncbi:hypothetical protein [Salinisphaera sp. G21_0]|uniref:hypothetical protein n=1 Tax=Salinisphaera sp. G21_0 TaxID=2821094 RepID=UPI001ADD2CD0|nr:hypothetical protein [Salinisphaera sp. G21_0]MBO9482733.1 hypothetical protein [Salinisphaera sp. G21_0]
MNQNIIGAEGETRTRTPIQVLPPQKRLALLFSNSLASYFLGKTEESIDFFLLFQPVFWELKR